MCKKKKKTIIISTPDHFFVSSVYTSKQMCVFQINVYCKRRDNSCSLSEQHTGRQEERQRLGNMNCFINQQKPGFSLARSQKQSLSVHWMDNPTSSNLPPISHSHFFLHSWSVHFQLGCYHFLTPTPHAQVRPHSSRLGWGGWDASEPWDWFSPRPKPGQSAWSPGLL